MFEAALSRPLFDKLALEIRKIIDARSDSVAIYRLCAVWAAESMCFLSRSAAETSSIGSWIEVTGSQPVTPCRIVSCVP